MTEHIQVVPDKCRACRRCEIACIASHHGMSFKEAMKHRDELVARVQVVKTDGFKTTVRCHQCPHAPCVSVCPTGALQQDEQGRIIMRVQYCVACKMCMAACPYGTITMETIGMPTVDGKEGETLAQRARREVAVRCDMCRAWRVENGKRITACMEACPAHALSLVLADGTVVEAPKPEKKEAPKAADAPQAEAAPAKTEAPAPAALEKGGEGIAAPAVKAPDLPAEKNSPPPAEREARPPAEKIVAPPAVSGPDSPPPAEKAQENALAKEEPKAEAKAAAENPAEAAPAPAARKKPATAKEKSASDKKKG